MKQLIVIYNMFAFKQQCVIINDKQEVEQTLYVDHNTIADSIIKLAYDNEIRNITIKGNMKLTSKIKDNIAKTEFRLYHINALRIALI